VVFAVALLVAHSKALHLVHQVIGRSPLGATEFELMALFGWESPKEAARYTKKANRKRMAARAIHLLKPDKRGTR
ncbi:MAG: hypothetical protein ACXWN9_16200, partial [Candidatus Binataceae bacterium]